MKDPPEQKPTRHRRSCVREVEAPTDPNGIEALLISVQDLVAGGDAFDASCALVARFLGAIGRSTWAQRAIEAQAIYRQEIAAARVRTIRRLDDAGLKEFATALESGDLEDLVG